MTNNKYESAKQYIENCKRNGPQSENKPRKDALYPMHGCQIYLDDKEFIKEFSPEPVLDGPLPSFCRSRHCTERGAWCAKCAYTAMGTMEK